jgi:polysaccharide biosynthesis protein PslG
MFRYVKFLFISLSVGMLLARAGFIIGRTDCESFSQEGRFGVVENLSWQFLYGPKDIDRALDMMVTAGINWVRLNWSWKDIEPEQGQFNYSQFDRVVAAAAERDVQLLAILTSVPPWSSTAPDELKNQYGNLAPVDRYRPANPDDWKLYVQWVVERYDGDGLEDAPGSPRIGHWEVWNEPNLSLFWPPEPDVREYVELLKISYEAITQADPSATVVLGGLSGSGINAEGTGYLQQIYKLGGAPYFDIVSVHHYLHPIEGKLERLQVNLLALREVLDTYDADIPIWLTEIGWSDAPNAWGSPTVSEQEIAEFLIAVYSTELPVEKIFWYNFRNIVDGSSEVEHNFGLVHSDFTPKPAYDAYKAVTQQREC